MSRWNGLSLLRHTHPLASVAYHVQTNASGTWGCGCCLVNQWFQYAWSTEWSAVGIMAKELVPIVIGAAVWGPLLSRKRIELQCDNQGLVSAINKRSAKDPIVMHLLHCLWFFTALFDIDATAIHIRSRKEQ